MLYSKGAIYVLDNISFKKYPLSMFILSLFFTTLFFNSGISALSMVSSVQNMSCRSLGGAFNFEIRGGVQPYVYLIIIIFHFLVPQFIYFDFCVVLLYFQTELIWMEAVELSL